MRDLQPIFNDLGLGRYLDRCPDTARYLRERAAVLAERQDDVDYQRALAIEAVNVTLYFLGREIDRADRGDAEIVQTVKTLLVVMVHLL